MNTGVKKSDSYTLVGPTSDTTPGHNHRIYG